MVCGIKGEIEQRIAGVDLVFISGTTDLWNSTAGQPHLTFTCHFIHCAWELQSLCLRTHYVPEDHTAVNIQEALTATLDQWKLVESRLVAITSDSASNVNLASDNRKWMGLSCLDTI